LNVTGNFLYGEHFGFQILASHFQTALSGANPPYDVALDYVSRPPPDYAPVQVSFTGSSPWPETEGHLRVFSLSANGLARLRRGRLTADFSGGLSYFNLRGEARSLGYTRLWLGGHSVLFLEEFGIEFSLEPTHQLGLNVGSQLSYSLGGKVELAMDGRYFFAPAARTDVRLTRIVRPEYRAGDSIVEIEEQMGPRSMEISPSFLLLGFGLKFKF
jgi:hypothetical protein